MQKRKQGVAGEWDQLGVGLDGDKSQVLRFWRAFGGSEDRRYAAQLFDGEFRCHAAAGRCATSGLPSVEASYAPHSSQPVLLGASCAHRKTIANMGDDAFGVVLRF